MKDDPIVREVHAAREKLLEACGGDLSAYLDYLQECEEEDKERLVDRVVRSKRRDEGEE
ncbi:MAG: hypothetical protein ACE5GW_05045 [Planctomycetota bacterium]